MAFDPTAIHFNPDIIKIARLEHFPQGWPLPHYKTFTSDSMDVRACLTSFPQRLVVLAPGEFARIPTGVAVEVPVGYELRVRSQWTGHLNSNVKTINATGTMDHDDRGEVQPLIQNCGKTPICIGHGDVIAQWTLSKVYRGPVQTVSYEELMSLSD